MAATKEHMLYMQMEPSDCHLMSPHGSCLLLNTSVDASVPETGQKSQSPFIFRINLCLNLTEIKASWSKLRSKTLHVHDIIENVTCRR